MRFQALVSCGSALVLVGLMGCGERSTTVGVTGAEISGRVHGGQQAIVNASIQLYAVGTTGDGSNATSLLTKPVTTDATGSFTITGLYSCSDATEVYITATGGNPSPGETNANLAMMTALGPCSSLTSGTYIFVNELTTAAGVNALAPFMKSYAAIGSGSGDAGALVTAFGVAGELVNTATGVSPGTNVPGGWIVPVATINTLGDIIAACLNSGGGVAGDGSPCGTLFTLTTPPQGVAPTNTVAALLNLANDLSLNTTQLYDLSEPQAPFQPQLTAVPISFAIGLDTGIGSIQESPTSITFPYTTVGSTTASQSVTILNTGGGAFGAGPIAISGANQNAFAVTGNCGTLPAGGSCTVQVTAKPTQPGVQYAALTGGFAPVSLSVPGVATGAQGNLTLSSTSLVWNIGGTLEDVTLSNPGTTAITIDHFQTASQNFPVMGSTCGTVLPAASSCTISIESIAWAPSTALGIPQQTDALVITDSAANSPQRVSLSSVNEELLSASTPSWGQPLIPLPAFGAVVQGSQQTQLLYMASESYYFASGINFSLGGTDSQDFQVFGTTAPACTSFPENCSVSVSFSPSGTGLRTGQILVSATSSQFVTGQQYLNVSGVGQGVGPSFAVRATSFGSTFLAPNNTATTTGTVVVANSGTTTVNPTLVGITGPAAANFSAATSGCSGLASLATCTVNITFNATAVGTYAATLAVTDTSLGVTNTTPLNVNVGYSILRDGNYSLLQPISLGAPAGTTSPGYTATIVDQNGNPLGHPVSATFSPQSMFSLSGGSACPASTSQVCTLTVVFTVPTGYVAGQTSQDTLVVTDLTSGNMISIPFTGVVTQ